MTDHMKGRSGKPADPPRKIDLTGIAGSLPWLKPLPREDFDDPPRAWDLWEKLEQQDEGTSVAAPIKSKTFKSGNSVALRLPKALGVEAGAEMTVREERGRFIVERAARSDRIDLTGIYGACPGLKPLERREMAPRDLDWEGKLLKRD